MLGCTSTRHRWHALIIQRKVLKCASAVLTAIILGSIHIDTPGNGIFHVIQSLGVFDDLGNCRVNLVT